MTDYSLKPAGTRPYCPTCNGANIRRTMENEQRVWKCHECIKTFTEPRFRKPQHNRTNRAEMFIKNVLGDDYGNDNKQEE